MIIWETEACEYGNQYEKDLLKRGWEPFAVVVPQSGLSAGRTMIYYRRSITVKSIKGGK